MPVWKKLGSVGLSAALTGSILAISLAGTAFATGAAATTPANHVAPNGVGQSISLGVVSFSATTDLSTTGNLTLTLPTGFAFTSDVIGTAETGAALAVGASSQADGATTATFAVSAVMTAAPATITFSGAKFKSSTAGASGNVVLTYSAVMNPVSITVATLSTGDHNGGDQDRRMGHGARKVGFFQDPAWTCPTGAQPVANAPTFGFAILNTTGNHKLNVNVVLKGALANASYDVWVNQDLGGCPLAAPTKVGAVHTNANGNGHGHLRLAVIRGATHFWVSATSGTSVLRTRAAALHLKHS